LVFYVHILRFVMWKADDKFLGELRATVEDHYFSMGKWAQKEYDLLAVLCEYRDRRAEFVKLGPCCERVDRAIRDWCVLPETDGDRSVLDCQYFISRGGRRLVDELRCPTKAYSYVLMPWEHIVADVLDRLDKPTLPESHAVARHSRDFLIRAQRRNERTARHYYGLLLALAALSMLILTLAVSCAFGVRMCWSLFSGEYLAAVLDGGLTATALIGGLAASLTVFALAILAKLPRYEAMRGDLINLFRVAPLPVDQLAVIVAAQEGKRHDDMTIDDAKKIATRMQSDAAMEFFSRAQICLSAADPEPVVEAAVADPIPIWQATLAEQSPRNAQAPTRPIRRRLQ
jgi:hypothetical protein